MAYENYNQKMESWGILIWNAADDPLISTRLLPFNYTPERFDEGKTLWKDVEELDLAREKELGEQKGATKKLNDATTKAETIVKDTKKLARLTFENQKAPFEALNLQTINFDRFEDWLVDSEKFYANLLGNEEWITAMEKYGYIRDQLEAGQKEIANVRQLQKDQFREFGDVQQAQVDKKEKLSELKTYCDHLTEVAKIALAGDAQLLEKLGILVRSE